MDPINFWKLCSEYSIVQAALLTCGVSPDEYQDEVERRARKPDGYTAVRSALYNAVRSGRLRADIRRYEDDFGEQGDIDLASTTIDVADLRQFLKANGFEAEIFERTPANSPSLSDGPHYPPKLAAALKAWTAVTADPARLRGKSPKQALESWLIENASDLGLINRNGTINRTGIDEICKVANWKPSGGATPTPSARSMPPQSALVRLPAPKAESANADFPMDDDIPF